MPAARAFAVLAVLSAAAPADAQLSDAWTMRTAAAAIEERSRELEEKAGPHFQSRALEIVRRSCAARAVTRLDEIAPASVTSEASATAPEPLFAIDFRVKRDYRRQDPADSKLAPALDPAAAPAATDAANADSGSPRPAPVTTNADSAKPAPVETAAKPAPAAAANADSDSSKPAPVATNADPANPAPPEPAATNDAANSKPAPVEPAAKPAPPPPPPAIERVDKDSDFELTPVGLLLKSGQVRTTGSFALARDSIGTIELDIATSKPGHLLLGWNEAADAPRLRRNNARIELVPDGHVHTYAVDAAATLARGLASGASLRRFFLSTRGEAPLEIRAMRVLSRVHRYAGGEPFGATHESRAGELRSVLWQRLPTTLAFDVDVPKDSPVFEAGLAVLAGDGVVEFEITAGEGESRAILMKRLVREAPWEDVALDLGAYAGKRVRLSLAVRGTRDAVALWSSPLVRPRLAPDKTEPFVVLLEDAMRADRLSLYGGPVASPAHERIAAQGLVFERAFAQATQTRSSVPSLMTSLMPSATGTWDFSDALSSRYVTLAEALRACGFATASFLQNGNAGAYAGLAQGFDVVFDAERFGPRASDLLAADSPLEKWIDRQRGRPYFAYVHVLDPHGPYDPAERPDLTAASEGEELQRDRSIDAEWLTKPTAEARRLLYDREVATNDAAIGGFVNRLEARGDFARSTFAVIADHGEFLGEHGGLWRHHPPGHFEVARVPFLLKTPQAKSRRIGEPVALLDLMPTLLELAGIDVAGLPMHGTSLANVLRGAAPPLRAIVADEMIIQSGERRAAGCGSFATASTLWLLSCTRDEDFVPGRLLAVRSGGPAPLRIFDLAQAPPAKETTADSTGSSFAEGVGRRALTSMQEASLAAWRRMTDAAAGRVVSDPADTERLRALGYVE
jgi:hypothetical protein